MCSLWTCKCRQLQINRSSRCTVLACQRIGQLCTDQVPLRTCCSVCSNGHLKQYCSHWGCLGNQRYSTTAHHKQAHSRCGTSPASFCCVLCWNAEACSSRWVVLATLATTFVTTGKSAAPLVQLAAILASTSRRNMSRVGQRCQTGRAVICSQRAHVRRLSRCLRHPKQLGQILKLLAMLAPVTNTYDAPSLQATDEY